jgi:hypothetical protein
MVCQAGYFVIVARASRHCRLKIVGDSVHLRLLRVQHRRKFGKTMLVCRSVGHRLTPWSDKGADRIGLSLLLV